MSELAVWGAVLTISTGVTMALFRVNIPAIAFLTAVVAGGYLLAWWLGGPNRTMPSIQAPPSSLPVPPGFPAPAVQDTQEPVAAIDPGSRWIDTFGPPETGQLPIQRYIADNGSVHSPEAGSGLPQWSHSRS